METGYYSRDGVEKQSVYKENEHAKAEQVNRKGKKNQYRLKKEVEKTEHQRGRKGRLPVRNAYARAELRRQDKGNHVKR
jgi:hypothetical protein